MLYSTPFPTLREMEQFILEDLPKRATQLSIQSLLEWSAELGANNHQLLKRFFDSRMDKTVARTIGQDIYERGGMCAMRANYYIYTHFINERLKDMNLTDDQWCEEAFKHGFYLAKLWDGVGEWRY